MTIHKEKIDTIEWHEVAKIVNPILGKNYSGAYCRRVYMRKETSGKLLEQIKIILDKEDVKNG